MKKDHIWLKQELSRVLGWDTFIVEGVVDTISRCKSRSDPDVKDVVENFMGNDAAAIKLIDEYLAVRDGKRPAASSGSTSLSVSAPTFSPAPKTTPAPASGSGSGSGASARSGSGSAHASPSPSSAGGGTGKEGGAAQHMQPQAQRAQHGGGASGKVDMSAEFSGRQAEEGSSKEKGGKVFGMFKEGGRLKPSTKGGAKREDVETHVEKLERQVVNCLSCGKVYDCRNKTMDITRFLERGGICTFCGAKVSLTYRDRSLEGASGTAGEGIAGPQGNGTQAVDDATAKAIDFKNRLVGYDRNSAQRTTVIDDQSDFFEIDSNAWLSDKEREEMKRRKKLEEEAEASRRRKITVTVDLIGRKVIVADDSNSTTPSFDTSTSTSSAPPPTSSASSSKASSAKTSSSKGVSAAVASEQGLAGSSVRNAEEVEAAVAAMRDMRIRAAPNISTSAPTFLPSSRAQGTKLSTPSKQQRAKLNCRVQDDDVFGDFEMEVLFDDLQLAS